MNYTARNGEYEMYCELQYFHLYHVLVNFSAYYADLEHQRKSKQGRQCTYNVTLRRVRATAVEKQ
jgi:hypothetical protein